MTWPLDVKARALALFTAGYGLNAIVDILNGPGRTTIQEWRAEANLSGLIREQSEELSVRYGRLLTKAADHLDTLPGDQLVKHILPMNAVRGTNQDKLRDSTLPQQTFNFILVKDQPSAQSAAQPGEPGSADLEPPYRMELSPTRTEPKAE